ncbi:MAG TPA: response regulator [Lacunisphaera sp.]|jgi:signal transduction histidine kinase
MKILHLEDNALDAALTLHVFLDEWPDCEVIAVETRDDFLAQLSEAPDLVVSDFSLAHFSGLEALQLTRRKSPDLPFIFLSGTIGEDRAIEALRAGANDYIIKDRPKRLIPAVQRALDDARFQRERHETEEQIRRVQRLENIGMLASGIAHDFNNILSPVLMGVSLLRGSITTPFELKILATIESSAERGAGLVRQIMGFGRGTTGEPQIVQPRHLISEVIGVVEQTFSKSIQIKHEVATDLWPIKVNATQFHQVLLNLCVNARDAMPQGGTLSVRASNRELDEMSAAGIRNTRPGTYLLLEIADSGTGIPPEVLARMWEPFFTTKEAGRGTGLGLATVRGIVDDHHGTMVVETRVGHGTTFQIFLPAEPDDKILRTDTGSVVIPRGNNELILVVDDDTNVRDVTCATLAAHGYRILSAADGAEALALFAPRNLEIREVVTDLDMPNLDGTALSKVLRALNPSVRILMVSGSSDIEEVRRRVPAGGCILAKPFTAEALLGTINKLLNVATTVSWPDVEKSS